jgi:hypothetical protein
MIQGVDLLMFLEFLKLIKNRNKPQVYDSDGNKV